MLGIIEYNLNFDENIKDLLFELQEYISFINREGYNILTPEYRESSFKDNMEQKINNQGKLYLAKFIGKSY